MAAISPRTGTVWMAPVGADPADPATEWTPIGRADIDIQWTFDSWTPDDAEAVVTRAFAGGTVSASMRLTPTQAHEWRWWLACLHRRARRPQVYGPRPLALGCLPAVRRRRSRW